MNEKQLQLLDVSVDRADDLNNMVNDMLDVSRLAPASSGSTAARVGWKTIVEHVRPNLERKAAIKNVTIEIDIDAGLAGRLLRP